MNLHRLSSFVSRWTLTLLILVSGGWVMTTGLPAQENEATQLDWAIALHGGAGSSPDNFSDEANASREAALQEALDVGKKILADGGTSLDAVEAVVRFLEDNPQFNAGKGAVFNAQGNHELDASIMDGSNLAGGAVAGVTNVRNPISLARRVMTETRHVLLAGEGAEAFAESQGIEQVDNRYFDTSAGRQRWEEYQERLRRRAAEREAAGDSDQQDDDEDDLRAELSLDTGSYHGTVGCVALDSHGNLAAATSTGGMTNKKFGRVGDSPILGAGTYADNATCAVSCTGIGEEFIRKAIAFDVAARMRYQGVSVRESVDTILESGLRKGDGGIIAVDHDGNVAMGFNTGGMARAFADSSGRNEVLWTNE